MLAVGDESLRTVEHISIARFFRRGAHALQVGACAGLAHGDGADEFARNELRQPAAFLLVGPVMENVGRDDPRVQRCPERVEARKTQFPADHCFVRKTTAGPAVFFGNSRAKEAGRAGFGPNFAVVHALLVPVIEVGHILGHDEAPRLLLEQHEVLGHPAGTWEVEDAHEEARCRAPYKASPHYARVLALTSAHRFFTTGPVGKGTHAIYKLCDRAALVDAQSPAAVSLRTVQSALAATR